MAKQKYWDGTQWQEVGVSASKATIVDVGNLITANNVEDALQESASNLTALQADLATDDTFKRNGFKSPAGYIAVYAKDQVPVKFALIPTDSVTHGVGGLFKIFGDDFSVDQVNYRDCGWYFSADQNLDYGYWNNGVFYINSKVGLGGTYDGKNPDIAFSFQDNVVLARFVFLNGGSGTFYIGNETGQNAIPIAREYNSIGIELGKSMGIKGGKKIYWYDTSASPVTLCGSEWADLATGMNVQADSNDLTLNVVNVAKRIYFNIAGSTVMSVASNLISYAQKLIANVGAEISVYLNIKGMLQIGNTNTITSGTTVDATGKSRLILNYASDETITDFVNGSEGQIMYCIFAPSATGHITFPHGINFILKNETSFISSSSGGTLVLIKTGTKWYQL